MELQGKVVTFIPTASTPESYKEYVKLGQESLEELGLKVTPLDVATASSEEIRSTLSEGDLIYISGGNTFYLLQELKQMTNMQTTSNTCLLLVLKTLKVLSKHSALQQNSTNVMV